MTWIVTLPPWMSAAVTAAEFWAPLTVTLPEATLRVSGWVPAVVCCGWWLLLLGEERRGEKRGGGAG